MKRLTFVCSIVFILFILFYDLKIGTIPIQEASAKTAAQGPAYKTVKVKPGDTVMSIVGPAGSPDDIVKDFEALNPNVRANAIQAGTAYKFPVYP
ncbi:MAG: LysM peptidoglycan-binding domain-containing protein [Bacillota bacterium]